MLKLATMTQTRANMRGVGRVRTCVELREAGRLGNGGEDVDEFYKLGAAKTDVDKYVGIRSSNLRRPESVFPGTAIINGA